MRLKSLSLAMIMTALAAGPALGQDRTPLEEFMDGFPRELSMRAQAADLPTLLMGGDEAVYFNRRASEFLPTSVLRPQQPARPLEMAEIAEIGDIEAETLGMGRMTLNAFIATPESFLEGIIVVHEGQIVFEQYPRMHPADHHLWMSTAKPTTSLVIDQLIAEGKIDPSEPLSMYVPEFAGTPAGEVAVLDALDMTTGLDADEKADNLMNPDSAIIRTFLAEFGMPYNGQVEPLIDVVRSAERLREPGETFQYSSLTTQLLVFLAEAVEDKRWADIFDERVWSKMHAEAPLQIHLTPDGIAVAHGLLSGPLRDLARFGMLYTPSWPAVATEQVVSDAIIAGIRDGVRSQAYFDDSNDLYAFAFGDDTGLSNSRQWDLVFADGDFYKAGLMGQGLYVSPDRDLVIAHFSVNAADEVSIARFLRPIATSGLFD